MKRWFKYVKPYLPHFIIGPLCMIVEVIGEVVMPKLMAQIINAANANTLTNGFSIRIMIYMIVCALLMMAGGVGGAWFGAKASVNFAADLRADMYSKIQKFSFENIDKFSTGSLVTRLTNDITKVQNFVNMLLRMALRAPGMMIAALIMAIATKPSLSLIFAVAMPILALTVVLLSKVTLPRFTRMQAAVDSMNTDVQENITNVRVVKSFVREDHEIEKFAAYNKEVKDSNFDAMKILVYLSPAITLFMNLTIMAVILFGGPIVLRGEMEVGDLSAFITYVTQILSGLMMVSMLFMFASRAIASGKRIREVLEEKVDLNDDNAALPDKLVENGTIEFKNVSFRYYKDSEEKVLNNINLTIPAKATVGIIGSTGCGKTTLVSMIPRLYDVDEGEVLVDDINVRDYSLVHLREGVSMVLQNNTLFSGTIAENLRWGDENATDEELIKFAEYAQADKFIQSFGEGYQTELTQGGTNVSGGQKQRLCIARALINKPKILILDDSTSAVDTATEAQIRKAFREELPDATKLIIAQRISSVQEADMIVVMDDGAITGIGTHDELLKSNEEYREIYESQTGKEVK